MQLVGVYLVFASLIVPSLPAFRVADLYQAMTGEPPAVVVIVPGALSRQGETRMRK